MRTPTASNGDAHPATAPKPAGPQHVGSLDFAVVYDKWFDDVARWLLALGVSRADSEDLAQEVFLVVRRRLSDFDGRNLAGWLYRIASRQVWQHRRRRWIKRVLSPWPVVNVDDVPDDKTNSAEALETKEKRRLLEHILSKMSDKRRVVFSLFEVEGYSGEEIADTLDVPINTVYTRLHHARKEFFALLAQHERMRKGER